MRFPILIAILHYVRAIYKEEKRMGAALDSLVATVTNLEAAVAKVQTEVAALKSSPGEDPVAVQGAADRITAAVNTLNQI
jgi:hypothetical protein